MVAWEKVTNRIVNADERAILRSMDRAFVATMNEELSDMRARNAPTPPKGLPWQT